MPADKIDSWIKSAPNWRSFVDIGGIGENSGNERVTAAVAAGGRRVVMADFEPFSHPLWDIFRRKMRDAGLSEIEAYEHIDVRDPELPSKLGIFDFVHSTGINYHLPDPVMGVFNLSRLSRRYMITNTVILPDIVENEHGRIDMDASRVMFLPAITDRERDILRSHYRRKFGWDFAYNAPRQDDPYQIMPYMTDTGLSCYPYWWLFSSEAFRSLVRLTGFAILDEHVWEDHTLALFCERTAV